MRKMTFVTIFVAMIGIGHSNLATAGVNINVGINVPPPPPLVIPAPPPVIVVPRTYVYFAPDLEAEIFFYHGYWYRPYQGNWYRSGSYNGRWVYISPKRMPTVLLNLPPDFRHAPTGHQCIPYGQVKKNWSAWEREKYWDKHGGKEWHADEKWEHKQGKGRGKAKHND